MKIRLYNARILTMEKDRDIFNGEIWIEENRITRVLSTPAEDNIENALKLTWDREIDCKGNLLMPGFKNAHTHSAMTFLRSYADDVPLHVWLNEKIFPMEAKLTADDIYELTRLAVLEYLTSGVTAIFDMYLTPDSIAQACIDTGMRCVLIGGINNFTFTPEEIEQYYLKWNEKDSLISYKLGFHAEYTCTRELLEQVAALAHKYKAPVYAHIAETEHEVEECISRYGDTPAVFLDSLGLFDFGGGGYHCVHMTDRDMEVFQKHQLHVITNPASNLKLASGIAPIAEYLKRGLNVAIGTDGPASNNCLDMFREMFLVSGLSKFLEKNAASLDAADVLRMATVNGSAALGLPDTDVLAEGKLADIILLDLMQPNMQPLHNIPKNLVYSGSKSNVLMTMINGQILYENGVFNLNESVDSIYEKCNEIVQRLTAAQ